MVNDYYCCCCAARSNFDANRLAYRFNNKDVTETNNNNNRSTQACTSPSESSDSSLLAWPRRCHRLNDLQIQWSRCCWHIIYSAVHVSTNATHSISYSNLRTVARSRKTFIMRVYMASFVSVCIGCLNFQKFGLPAIVYARFSFVCSIFFIIIIMFLHYQARAARQESFFSRKPSEEKKNWSAKMKKINRTRHTTAK